jgi:hypothetical protein
MYPDILTKEQKDLLPLMSGFRREFYLVGGTAIALQLGHRMSIDFDMFKLSRISSSKVFAKLDASNIKYKITRRVAEQINITINEVKLTFFQYPFSIDAKTDFQKTFKMPDLISLSAMKAYALGHRAKWKDYVDLYFLIKDYCSVDHIIQKANFLFGQQFNEKLFRAQLAYHKDIDYSEPVEYMSGFETDEQEIKDFLINVALERNNKNI